MDKSKIYTLAFVLLLLSCTPKQNNIKTSKKATTVSKDTPKVPVNFHPLKKLFVVGDFDGDKKTDTIYQHNFSNLQKKEIEYAPSPFKVDWDKVVKWFFDQDADVMLSLNKKNSDVLHLGTAQGLYCLINIGDTNKDGKDQIAFVVDELDESRTNTCKIYSLCNGKWQLLKEFGIREDAFDWKKEEAQPKFNSIKGYLEKQDNIWKYKDNNQEEYDSPEELGKMQVLKLDKCK